MPVPPKLSSEATAAPGRQLRVLLARVADLCNGETPIALPLEGRDAARLKDELTRAPAAVLWGRPGAGAGALDEVAHTLDGAGVEICWAGLVRSDGATVADLPMVVAGGTWREALTAALACGPASLALDSAPGAAGAGIKTARVAIVSYEVVGPTRNGGIGTATTSLACSLAAAGHEVILRYCGWDPLSSDERARWQHFYSQFGVDFDALSEGAPGVDSPSFNQRRSYEAYRWLSEENARAPFDVVHFPDCQGHGYYALLAKRLGLDFAGVTMVVGVHSPTRWILESNETSFLNLFQLADDHMERESVALADVVVSPSAYMLGWIERAGWSLPQRSFVHQYVLPRNLARVAHEPVPAMPQPSVPLEGPGVDAARDLGIELRAGADQAPSELIGGGEGNLREIVFFGRLEVRKGIEQFCDALDELASHERTPDVAIAFLGKPMLVHGVDAVEYLERRAKAWPWPWTIHADLNQLEAIEYLRRPGRLAVMASPVDNSPNTVYEALALGIGFVAARTGGIPELVHPADVEQATYVDGEAGELARTLRAALDQQGEHPPRFAVDPEANVRAMADWHGRVAAARREPALAEAPPLPRAARNGAPLVSAVLAAEEFDLLRPTLDALERQDVESLETVLGAFEDEGAAAAYIEGLETHVSERAWRVARIPGRGSSGAAARRHAASTASGEWLWLTRPGAVGDSKLLSTLVACAAERDADLALVSTAYGSHDQPNGTWRGFVPLGACLASLIIPEGGPGGVLVRRTALAELGGLEGRSVATQHRNLVLRAALDGRRIAVVPQPLLRVIDGVRSEPFPDDAMRSLARPLAERLPADLADIGSVLPRLTYPLLAPTPVVPDDVKIYVGKLEREMREIVDSKSWRWTRNLRDAADWARRQVRGR
jgi:O-antigen biosynthesis protein